jgi:transcription antitermination factor NusG
VLCALEKAVAMSNYGTAMQACALREHYSESVATPAQQWYALAVKPRHDRAVSGALEHKGYQTLVPLYKKRRPYSEQTRESELPLFPGYIFCRFNCSTRLPILTTPGVMQILGAGRTPIPVEESEIASLQTALHLQLPVQPFPFLETGQKVRITEGALVGVEGIVMSFKQCLRLVLSIGLLQRSVLLEIDRDCVSPEGLLQASGQGVRHAN